MIYSYRDIINKLKAGDFFTIELDDGEKVTYLLSYKMTRLDGENRYKVDGYQLINMSANTVTEIKDENIMGTIFALFYHVEKTVIAMYRVAYEEIA